LPLLFPRFNYKGLNKKVGLFDSDIYGPSLPTLVNRKKETVRPNEENDSYIDPILFEDLKLMSFGFVSPDKRAVIRGPMVSNIVSKVFYVNLKEHCMGRFGLSHS
jgi:Mrp family chromosome partitioning ATPase